MENKEEQMPQNIENQTMNQDYNSSYNEASQNLKNKKKVGWFGRLYGLSDEEDEDLEFVYSNYAYANEQPNRVSNLVFLFVTLFFLQVQ